MTLGEKLKQARLDRNLSQRQAAGDRITRNMLSLLEADRARPSMRTLEYLAGLYDRPVSWFLDESETQTAALDQARACFRQGRTDRCLALTESLTASDEGLLLRTLSALTEGRQALEARQWVQALRLGDTALMSAGAGLYGQDSHRAQANLIRARALLALDRDPAEAMKALTAAQIAQADLGQSDLYRQILQALAPEENS